MRTSKLIFFIFFLFFSVTAFGQLSQEQLDSLVKKYTQSLRAAGVDTICVYEEYCIGCLFYSDKDKNLCLEKISFLPTYIFWKHKGKSYMTKKDACFDYSVQKISSEAFWYYYLTNRDKIKKEELKAPQYKEIINGKEKIHSIDIDHSIYFRISLNIGNDSMTKDINNFYFTKELGINGEQNINYDYNMLSALNNLHSVVQKTIKAETGKKRLVATLR